MPENEQPKPALSPRPRKESADGGSAPRHQR